MEGIEDAIVNTTYLTCKGSVYARFEVGQELAFEIATSMARILSATAGEAGAKIVSKQFPTSARATER